MLPAVNRVVGVFESECAEIAACLEDLESRWLGAVKSGVQAWSEITAKTSGSSTDSINAILGEAKGYSARTDLSKFIRASQSLYGKSTRAEQYTYDLPFTLADIKERNFTPKGRVFHTTLDDMMRAQREADSNDVSGLGVPAIVLVLISAIQKAGGFTAEGIFRISAQTSDLDRLKKQIQEGNYDVQEGSPHVSAGLLKYWMRNLAEPLIPAPMYEPALALARDAKLDKAAVASFVARLPRVNRDVIGHVANMAQEIVAFESVNRMNMKNLAIVFAPGMLRYNGDDPQTMLANSKFEVAFMVQLLTHFPFDQGQQ